MLNVVQVKKESLIMNRNLPVFFKLSIKLIVLLALREILIECKYIIFIDKIVHCLCSRFSTAFKFKSIFLLPAHVETLKEKQEKKKDDDEEILKEFST